MQGKVPVRSGEVVCTILIRSTHGNDAEIMIDSLAYCLLTDSSKTTAFDLPEQALAAASVELRQSSTSSCGTAPTTFILYQTPALFRDTSMPRNTTVGSQVISAQVRGLNKSSRLDLAQPANMSFKLVNAPKQVMKAFSKYRIILITSISIAKSFLYNFIAPS